MLSIVDATGPPADAGEAFEAWWKRYPRKESKQDARRAWKKATSGRNAVTPEHLTERLAAQVRKWDRDGTELRHRPYAATWLNGRRWEDEALDAPAGGNEYRLNTYDLGGYR